MLFRCSAGLIVLVDKESAFCAPLGPDQSNSG
jgi:hypothetical protein